MPPVHQRIDAVRRQSSNRRPWLPLPPLIPWSQSPRPPSLRGSGLPPGRKNAITVPARASPVIKETADRVASRIINALRMIFRRRTGQPCRRSCATSFGPVVRARSTASACVRPPNVVRKSRSSSSPSFRAACSTAGETRTFWFFGFVGLGPAAPVTAARSGLLSCVHLPKPPPCHPDRVLSLFL
ncbi:MAG: hypothetical protein JWO19_3970 [Bryobacterales bacterium]|jgi:hypothetical protein|nr:hypothetical protein [Bryobacterales bacterium]